MKILFGKQIEVKKGIDMCCDAVRVSLGHNGKNVLISNGQVVDIINDGVTIAKFVDSKNEVKKAGIRLAQQCAGLTNQKAGDGTTTTLVLLQSLLNKVLDETQIEQPREMRRKILKSVDKVLEKMEIKKATKDDIENIAITASLSQKIGKLVSGIFKKLGNDASISIDSSRYDVLESEIINGYQFQSVNSGLYQEDREEMTDVPVVTFKKAAYKDIEQKIVALNKEGENKILVIASQFTKDIIAIATKFNAAGKFKIALVQERDNCLEDIVGNRFEKVLITQETTTLIGGNGNTKEIVDKLKKKLEKEESSYQKELLEKRISSLTNGVAIITVGGNSEVEREETKLKVEDAINAVKTSLQSGYVKGGGVALKEAGKGEFIEDVCNSVYDQICENSEKKIKVGDNVMDSFLTIKASLQSAASIATSVLTAEVSLIEEDDD